MPKPKGQGTVERVTVPPVDKRMPADNALNNDMTVEQEEPNAAIPEVHLTEDGKSLLISPEHYTMILEELKAKNEWVKR